MLDARPRSPARFDLWKALGEQLDLGRYVPCPSDDVEIHYLVAHDGSTYVVLRSHDSRYLRLDQEDFALWTLMDGRRSVQEIAMKHFLAHGDFAAARLARLVSDLRAGGFLGPVPPDWTAAVGEHRDSGRFRAWGRRLGQMVATFDVIRIPRADAAIGAFYRTVGWVFYTRPAKLLWILTVVLGLAVWFIQFMHADHSLLKTNGSYLLGLITIAALDVLGITLHDFAQALTLKRHGRRINSAGLMLYYLMPTLYLETSDVWLAKRSERVAVTWSGPFSMLVLGSVLAIMAMPMDGTELGSFLFKGATIWLANAFFNLLPILDLDGYYMLVDYLEMPALRQNSLSYLRSAFFQKLRHRERLVREEWVFAAFGLGSALLVLLIPIVVYRARDLRYADSLLELWNSPEPLAETMALAMFAMFLGPAAVAIATPPALGAMALARIGVQKVRGQRGRVPAEHVQALAQLPLLRDASRAELVAMAQHLRPQTASTGTILVRQGGHGDRFFLIQKGTVRVEKLTSDGERVTLAKLGGGEYFGETALLAGVPRTASVIAESDVRLLAMDAGHFRRWVADRAEVASALKKSLADRDRLASLPVLRGTSPAELDRLVGKMLVTRHSPGDEIVRQGEPGDRFFLLVDGRVDVLRDDGSGAESVAELGPGEFFGEMALLYDEPRSATVRAKTPVEAYTLNASDFHALLGRLQAGAAVRQTAARRASQRKAAALT